MAGTPPGLTTDGIANGGMNVETAGTKGRGGMNGGGGTRGRGGTGLEWFRCISALDMGGPAWLTGLSDTVL